MLVAKNIRGCNSSSFTVLIIGEPRRTVDGRRVHTTSASHASPKLMKCAQVESLAKKRTTRQIL